MLQMEEKIIGMLEQIMSKQDEHSRILNEHTEKLDEHSRILNEHTEKLNEHSRILNEHTEKLNEHSKILNDHSEELGLHRSTLDEHGQILSALRHGQEHLKAEIDGIKVSNAKEFGDLKNEVSDLSANMVLLRDETWENKTNIYRIQKTMGMQ